MDDEQIGTDLIQSLGIGGDKTSFSFSFDNKQTEGQRDRQTERQTDGQRDKRTQSYML